MPEARHWRVRKKLHILTEGQNLPPPIKTFKVRIRGRLGQLYQVKAQSGFPHILSSGKTGILSLTLEKLGILEKVLDFHVFCLFWTVLKILTTMFSFFGPLPSPLSSRRSVVLVWSQTR